MRKIGSNSLWYSVSYKRVRKIYLTLVSIIITTQNRAQLLGRAISSVINQTYKNIEIVVVDDCSNDDTQEVVKKFQDRDSRIVYLKNNVQSGANVSRNNGITIAKGRFIAGLDDDDEFVENRIERFLEEYDTKFAFLTSLNIIKDGNHSITSTASKIVTLGDMYKDNITNQGFIERQRVIDVGLYDINLKAYQDYDMWLRLMIKYGNIKVIQEYLQVVHSDSDRNRISTDGTQKFSGYFCFYKKYKNILPLEERKNKLFLCYKIRKKKMSFSTMTRLRTQNNEGTLLNYYRSSDYAFCSYLGIQSLYKFIKSLPKDKQYIIYGYGSLGQLILPLIKENVIAIIDKNNLTVNDFNIPIITLDQLSNYDTPNVIITPIPNTKEIAKELKIYNCNIVQINLLVD